MVRIQHHNRESNCLRRRLQIRSAQDSFRDRILQFCPHDLVRAQCRLVVQARQKSTRLWLCLFPPSPLNNSFVESSSSIYVCLDCVTGSLGRNLSPFLALAKTHCGLRLCWWLGPLTCEGWFLIPAVVRKRSTPCFIRLKMDVKGNGQSMPRYL